jgi:hypothetical protein
MDGFNHDSRTWLAKDVAAIEDQDTNFGDFQNIDFIRQSDGSLYLIGFHNTAPSIDFFPGRDYADLYRVEFEQSLANTGQPELSVPVITKIANRHFRCEDGNCNLDAGAGLYIDETGNFTIYAISFWLDDSKIKITEFHSK